MHRSRLAVAGMFLLLAVGAALAHQVPQRYLAPPPPDRRTAEALELVAAWLDARAAGDEARVASYMVPGLASTGTLALSPTSNPHVEAYFVYPLGPAEPQGAPVQVILHEVFTGEPYGALYSETVTVRRVGSHLRIAAWQPAGGPEVSAIGEGPPGGAHTLVYEDTTGRRVLLPRQALEARAGPDRSGSPPPEPPERFGPLAVAPQGRFVAFSALGRTTTLLGVWDALTQQVYFLDAYRDAKAVDLHWSRSGAYLAVTVRTAQPVGRIALYTWPQGQVLPVPWDQKLGGRYSLQALRWDPLREELLFGTGPLPGAGAVPRKVWRLRVEDLSVHSGPPVPLP